MSLQRAALLVVLALLSGCADSTTSEQPEGLGEGPEAIVLRGIVIDIELIPVADAFVTLRDTELSQTTGPDGRFEFPIASAGTYNLLVERTGYAPASTGVVVGSESVSVSVQLTPIAQDVPYFETQLFVTTVGCAVATPTSRMSCGLINQVAGSDVTPDTSVFQFEIANPGLAMLLGETAWEAGTAFSNQLSVNLLDVEGDQTNCVSTKCYSEAFGPSPVRFMHYPGVAWSNAGITYEPFPGDQGHKFNAYIMPPFGTAENPGGVFLEQRADNYLTFFYNRVGSPEFSALPDA